MKTCSKCGAAKPETEFYRKSRQCKACVSAIRRERYRTDPEYRQKTYDNALARGREIEALRSSRVRRFRKLIQYFAGRGRYLDLIAHALDRRTDARSLQWLCPDIDGLIAARVYNET
jgi:hypothetical protein